MFRKDFLNGFQFNNNLITTDKIWYIGLFQQAALIRQLKLRLGHERNAPMFKFICQTFLINGF